MINVCTTSAPGQKECDMALRQIQAMRPILDRPAEPINDASYFECLDGVIERYGSIVVVVVVIVSSPFIFNAFRPLEKRTC
jgi:hypothetical protein